MYRIFVSLVGAAALVGCSAVQIPDHAIMPRTAAGTPVMSDQGAMGLASYALGSRSRTAGQPGEAARAVGAIEYLAGALYQNPHWDGIPATTKLRMLRGRDEIRTAFGIAPGAPSQAVLNGLIGASVALDGHDGPAAVAALSSPVFTYGPERTLALLNDLPPLPAANIAAQTVNADTVTNCQFSPNCS